MRSQRLALSDNRQQEASAGLTTALSTSPVFKNSRHIAFYLANGGEIDPQPLLQKAWQLNKSCYLPILDGNGENRLFFAPYTQESRLIDNRYGIPEPEHETQHQHPAVQLDLVLVPLVAIDSQGNRLGMGKGFYDRTFEFLQSVPRPGKPVLIGLAHSFQQVEQIDINPWDVALDGVANENELILFG